MYNCKVGSCMLCTAESDLDKLCEEFADYDRGLLEGMLADQGGDVAEVHACLRVLPSPSTSHACTLHTSSSAGWTPGMTPSCSPVTLV